MSTGSNLDASQIPNPNVCRWIIRSPGAGSIALTFSNVVLRGGGQIFVFSGWANVWLYSGMVRTKGFPFEASAYAAYSAKSRPPSTLVCPADQVLVVFTTDPGSAAQNGFDMSWRAGGTGSAHLGSRAEDGEERATLLATRITKPQRGAPRAIADAESAASAATDEVLSALLGSGRKAIGSSEDG